MNLRSKLLWVDCLAGAVVGVIVLLASEWLSDVYEVSRGLLLFTGAANVAYAAYSFSLAIRSHRPLALIGALVAANLTWAGVCIGLVIAVADTASPFGLAHLAFEGVFVGGLALLEWRWRELLRTA